MSLKLRITETDIEIRDVDFEKKSLEEELQAFPSERYLLFKQRFSDIKENIQKRLPLYAPQETACVEGSQNDWKFREIKTGKTKLYHQFEFYKIVVPSNKK